MYKIVSLKANAKKIVTLNAFDTKYINKCYCEGKCKGNSYLNMHLTPNMYKIITLRHMLRTLLLENAFDTKYVQNRYLAGKCKGNHHCKMCFTPNRYKIITLKANNKKIVTWKCIWHHICAKPLLCRQMPGKSLL